MGRLLQLIIQNGGFVTFLLVEVFCFYAIVRFNETQKAIFTNTASIFAGSTLEKRQRLASYLGLQEKVDSLVAENIRLQAELANARMVQVPYRDTFFNVLLDTLLRNDSLRRRVVRPQYEFISAKVIGNSISGANNWLMLNRGSNDGLRPNMGVITGSGIVGIVRHTEPNFSMAMSVLHRLTKVSVILPQHKGALGVLFWEGGNPAVMTLKSIPHHFKVKEGDKVETSGYSQLFPKSIPVGRLEGRPEPDPENPYFWILKVRLSQDMSTLSDVYVADNIFHTELDSLQLKVKQ